MCFYAHENCSELITANNNTAATTGKQRVLLSIMHCELPKDWKEMNKLLITRTRMQREAITSTVLDYVIHYTFLHLRNEKLYEKVSL